MRVGDKVVCVDENFASLSTLPQGVQAGEVYTIRWAGNFNHYIDGSFFGVKLAEVDRGKDDGPGGYGYDDMPFRASRFEPVVEPKHEHKIEEMA